MILHHKNLNPDFRNQLIEHTYRLIGCMHTVCNELPSGLPEYLYQEALGEVLDAEFPRLVHKEYEHHPNFRGHTMKSFIRMDYMVERPDAELGNVIIECKAIKDISDHERQQLFSYMIASGLRVGILVNFATYPKAQIERYYHDPEDMTISAY